VGDEPFDRWFQPLRIVADTPTKLLLEAPNLFFRDWIKAHYWPLLQEAVGTETELEVSVGTPLEPSAPFVAVRAAREEGERLEADFNPKYTFEQFVIGSGNRFAHAASLAVAESPAKAYNPLFIYGSVGLGKTHLLQAIGHAIHQRFPQLRVCYISSERFTNELITAIQTRTTVKFRQKYRSTDVLLIDDIHFVAGKESTQEELFHTFNTLYDAHRQIVLSSDRSPKEIAQLEERLVSRFEWGLVTDVQSPDLETRIAILRRKVQDAAIQVPEEVPAFIAERISSNVRELEGALIRVVAFAKFTGREVTLDLAQEVLKGMLVEEQQKITIERIQRRVAEFFGLAVEELRGKRRNRAIILPRHVAMFLARELTQASLPELGRAFGGRDHTTILHALQKVKGQISQGGELCGVVEHVRRGL